MTIDWQARLETFLAIREALGLVSRPARILLQDFISHIESHHIPVPVPAQVIVEWATSSRGASGHCARLSLARLFLEHVRAFVPETIVPPKGLLATRRRPHPYLFAPEDIRRLMESPITIRPHYTLRPYLVRTLVGLLASTGIRIGEALNLRVEDVSLDSTPPFLHIRNAKFHKSRYVPLHPTVAVQLSEYASIREAFGYAALSEMFFMSEQGTALTHTSLQRTFSRLCQRLGISPINGHHPTLHSFRHTFAVQCLVSWSERGDDIHVRLPNLAVYLGHLNPQETYWYLTATPQLLNPASLAFQRFAGQGDDL
ncbi:MAG TPA: tyrosine-type recombinase/integrase [Acidobacteriota bacterium]|nr:tyrosine-type recombinase/integrase [Acidobacteriota bacterium]